MSLVASGKTVYIKTQYEEVCFEINDKNDVEVKQVDMDSELKMYFEKITTSTILTDNGKKHDFLGN